MATDILKLFTSLGLTPTESKIYLASLSLGPDSVQEIAKRAKLSRTACYAAVEALQRRGLMSAFERGKKKFFAAEEPENALAQFRGYVKQMEQQIDVLQRALPEVKMMAGGERPSVRFYEGAEALQALFSDVSRSGSKFMYEVSNYDDIYESLDPAALKEARQLLDPRKTQMRILYAGEPRSPRPEVAYGRLPDDAGEFHGDIWIYGNRVALVTFVGRIVVVIVENKALSDTARALYETAWQAVHASENRPVAK